MQPKARGKSIVITWTGHRQLADENTIRRAMEQAVDRVLEEHLGTGALGAFPCPLVGMGPLAVGADLLMCEVLLDRGVPLLLLLPCDSTRLEPHSSEAARLRIAQVLQRASAITIVANQGRQEDEFLEAGVRALEDADLLLAVWDRLPQRGPGGTAQVVAAAEAQGIPIARIDPLSGEVEWPQGPLSLATDHAPVPLLRNRRDVESHLSALDARAAARARPARRVALQVIYLHLLAAAVAIVALLADPLVHLSGLPLGAAILKVSILLLAVWLASRIKPAHHAWLEHRTEAELCRSFLAVWPMRRDVIVLPPAPTQASEALRRELGLAWRIDVPRNMDLDEARTGYIGSVELADGRLQHQRRYFIREHRAVRHVDRIIRIIAPVATWTAIVCAIAAVGLSLLSDGSHGLDPISIAYTVAKGLSILLPLAIAAVLSFGTAIDLTRRSRRFTEMIERLDAVAFRAGAARTWPALGRAVTDAEWLLQAELAEWHAFNRYAGEVH